MAALAAALADLDDAARVRVLEWGSRRYGAAAAQTPAPRLHDNGHSGLRHQFEAFVDLFDAAAPRTDSERALVGGFWFQVVQDAPDFVSQQVNDALKDVGHGVGNITDALTKLQRRKPALVRQVEKGGKTRQARKRYKLTAAGIGAVRELLSRAERGE